MSDTPKRPSANKGSPAAKKRPPVTLFTAPGCPWCAKAKGFFKRHNIRFHTVDLSSNKQALQDCKKAGCSGVPVVLVGRQWICGYDEGKMKRALGLS